MTMPVLKFKTLVNFPAQVYGRTGITVTKTAGAYYLDLDYSVFTPSGPPPADASVVFYSPINNSYSIGPVTSVAGIPEAPLDSKTYSRNNAAWIDAWASPVLTGNPTAPTASPGDNDTSIATTAFVHTAVVSGSGIADALSDGKTYGRNNAAWIDAWASPVLTGNPTAPTATVGDNDTSIATTAFVQAAVTASSVTGIPQNSKSAAYTTVLADQEKHLFHPSADTTARIWTIDSNANVAYPIGTAITFVNQNAAGVITIAITTDTMRLAGAGTTGNRTLAANGVATALKITATEWIISGTGLT